MTTTRVLNFGHPLHADAEAQLRHLVGEFETESVSAHLDFETELAPQVQAALDGVALSREEWATMPIVAILPGMSAAAALVVAELAGRTGALPRIAVLSRGDDGVFRLKEIIDLQQGRNVARTRR